jgi:hypothetical protein
MLECPEIEVSYMFEMSPFSCGNFSDTQVLRVAERQYAGVTNSATVILMLKTRTCG